MKVVSILEITRKQVDYILQKKINLTQRRICDVCKVVVPSFHQVLGDVLLDVSQPQKNNVFV